MFHISVFCQTRFLSGEDAVRNRRLAISAAVVGSLGIALVPALAEAAQSSTTQTVNTAAKSSASTFTKNRTKQFSAHSSKTAVRRSSVSASTPNPELEVWAQAFNTSAYGVEVDLAQTGLTTGTAAVTIAWGDGSTSTATLTTADDASSEDGTWVPATHAYTSFGVYNVTITIDDGAGDTASTGGALETGSLYHAFGPTRVLDTRKGLGESKTAPIAAGGTLKLQVTGSGTGIPAGITAVVMNVTATGGTANGALSVYGNEDAGGVPIPADLVTTSNLNYRTGQNIPNLVVVPVGQDGVADFYNNSKGSVGVIADVAGYFTADSTGDQYVPISPARILDTRKGVGASKAQIPANGSITLTVEGAASGKIPANDVSAVAVNLTAVDSTANGVITAYPADESLPTASNINYSTGQTVANMATVPVSSTGKIVVHNTGTKPVDVIADAAGYYTSDTSAAGASAYIPSVVPERWLDTRLAGPGFAVQTGDTAGLPFATSSDEAAFVMNATVVSPTGNGFLSLYSFDPTNPNAIPGTSNLNYRTGQTVPNLAIVAPGTNYDSDAGGYDVGLYLGGSGNAQVILDYFGEYYTD